MKYEEIDRRIKRMIIMDIRIDNFYAFKNFHMNMSYPKKIVNSSIKNEHLKDYPNFRYKKVNILMGANATGKTSFGKILMYILNFMEKKQYDTLVSKICDKTKEASFTIDFIAKEDILYHAETIILPKQEEEYENSNIKVKVKSIAINKKDSYESCLKRLKETKQDTKNSYIEELEKIKGLSWSFQYPDDYIEDAIIRTPKKTERYVTVLEAVLKALDPSIVQVEKSGEVEDTFVIRTSTYSVIIQEGRMVNRDLLSSGTKAGIEVAGMITNIIEGDFSLYYCDEKFSYIHTDIEKAVLSVMIDALHDNAQLFFTTHNTDILDLELPKHSYTFLRKNMNNETKTIECITASSMLKRSTDSLKSAVENDLFSVAPETELIFEIANI